MRTSSQGFSLLEIMIVVVAMAVILAAAIPQVAGARENYRLISVANDLVARLNQARIMAISRNADFRVSATSTTTYQIQQETAANVWTAVESLTLPTGFTITATDPAEFHSRGSASPNGTFTVTNPNSRTRQVLIDVSGRVYAQ